MKVKGESKFKLSIILSFVLAVAIIIVTVILYRHSYFESLNIIMTFAIGVMSLIISVVALLVALSTYFSIDSVNAISSMEGNVLCNENYNAEYALLIEKYSHCKNQDELEVALFEHLHSELKNNSKTCMEFTDTIQDILDHILWYAYVDTRTERYRAHVNEIISLLNEKYESFSAISNGNQYLLKEHIKLIMNVLNYQSVAHEGSIISPNGEMLNVRGRMFLNTVSRTIYYDYLGLEYYRKAIKLLKSTTGFEGEEFVLKNMKVIASHSYTEDEKNELYIYLSKAGDSFDKACESSKEDILWNGYISFNKARVDLLSMLIENKFDEGWDESINAAISARYSVMKIFVGDDVSSFLHCEFKKEYYYAKALLLLISKYLGNDSTDIINEAQIIKTIIPDSNEKNGTIFKRTNLYLDDIINS